MPSDRLHLSQNDGILCVSLLGSNTNVCIATFQGFYRTLIQVLEPFILYEAHRIETPQSPTLTKLRKRRIQGRWTEERRRLGKQHSFTLKSVRVFASFFARKDYTFRLSKHINEQLPASQSLGLSRARQFLALSRRLRDG